jgi:hypothetical protein
MAVDSPEQASQTLEGGEQDDLERFRNWHGFLLAALAVNALFVYGMLGNVADPGVRTWFKALVWLPFNAIATAVYFMLAVRLSKRRGGPFYGILCLTVVVANWVVMLTAGN